jgi:hypothetical protein
MADEDQQIELELEDSTEVDVSGGEEKKRMCPLPRKRKGTTTLTGRKTLLKSVLTA